MSLSLNDSFMLDGITVVRRPCGANIGRNLAFIISGLFFIFLVGASISWYALVAETVFLIALVVWTSFFSGTFHFFRSHFSLASVIGAFVVAFLLAYHFYVSVIDSSEFESFTAIFGNSAETALAIIAILDGVLSLYFCCIVIGFIVEEAHSVQSRSFWKNIVASRVYARVLMALVVIGFITLIVCSFNFDLWIDEAFSIQITKHSLSEIIQYTAVDVHPPLYYLMLKAVTNFTSLVSDNFAFTIIASKLFSVLAYVLTAIVCWFKLRDLKTSAYRLIVLLGLFATANMLLYGIEIRMYAWGLFFVTVAYLYARDIQMGKGGIKAWCLLIISSLCSAYTHYFALVAVVVLWLCLLVWIVRHQKSAIKWWAICGAVTLICYVPWIFVLLQQLQTVSQSYWIEPESIGSVLEYISFIFSGVLVFILVLISVQVFRDFRRKEHVFGNSIGIIVVLMTLIIGIVVSIAIRPMFVNRYIIPCILCLWISAVLVLRTKEKQLVCMSIVLAVGCVVSCVNVLQNELSSIPESARSMDFVASVDDDSVFCVDEDESTSFHILYTLAAYTDAPFYFSKENRSSEAFAKVYPNTYTIESCNIATFDDLISSFLADGKTVYFITYDPNSDALPTYANSYTYFGTYLFEYDAYVYKITPAEYVSSLS